MQDWTPNLVILDTAPHFQPVQARGEVTNSYSFNRKELLRLKRWASKHGSAVFVLYHCPKQNEKSNYPDPFDRVLGSTAILASSVAVCILERVDDDQLKIHFRSHVSTMESPRYFNYSDFTEIKDIKAAPEEPFVLGKAEALVLALIPSNDYVEVTETIRMIAKTLKKGDNQVRNVVNNLIKKLRVDVRVDKLLERRYLKKILPS